MIITRRFVTGFCSRPRRRRCHSQKCHAVVIADKLEECAREEAIEPAYELDKLSCRISTGAVGNSRLLPHSYCSRSLATSILIEPPLPALNRQQNLGRRQTTLSNNRCDNILSAWSRINSLSSIALNQLYSTSSHSQPILTTRNTSSRLYSTTNHHNQHQEGNTTNNSGLIMAKIISGKEVADEIRASLKSKVEQLSIKPKLVIVQVGGREDSNVYIRMKIQFAESIGATAELVKLSRDVTEQELAEKIHQLNKDKNVHGIITQLPFDCTTKINSDYIVNQIDPQKDVDGLSVYNAGKLSHGELDSSSFVPCTPNGCMELIRKSGVKVEGSHSVVIGRSKIVGSPMAQLLLWNNSTVTICHSKTKNLEEVCRQADILVAAVGRAQMVKRSWLKPGAVVIDCGINVIPDATKKSGTRLVGDVDFDDCKEVAGAITPVPGGVGPMTVAMLIANTVESATRASQA